MHISEINVYPIKSLKGISLKSAIVEPRGLYYDRRWMLIDSDGVFMTQREFPQMATMRTSVDDTGLFVEADGFGRIEVPLDPGTGDRRKLEVWGNSCEGDAYDRHINQWFSDAIGEKCELVYMPDDAERAISERFNLGGEIVSFADGYPLLVIGEASLADLNARLAATFAVELPLPMNRFRPNIVVSGSEAFAEDRWQRIRVGEAIFRVVKPCARCSVTTVDQARGEFGGKEPLTTLASYRQAKQVFPDTFESFGHTANAVLFGENLVPETPGVTIDLDSQLEVLEYR